MTPGSRHAKRTHNAIFRLIAPPLLQAVSNGFVSARTRRFSSRLTGPNDPNFIPLQKPISFLSGAWRKRFWADRRRQRFSIPSESSRLEGDTRSDHPKTFAISLRPGTRSSQPHRLKPRKDAQAGFPIKSYRCFGALPCRSELLR